MDRVLMSCLFFHINSPLEGIHALSQKNCMLEQVQVRRHDWGRGGWGRASWHIFCVRWRVSIWGVVASLGVVWCIDMQFAEEGVWEPADKVLFLLLRGTFERYDETFKCL